MHYAARGFVQTFSLCLLSKGESAAKEILCLWHTCAVNVPQTWTIKNGGRLVQVSLDKAHCRVVLVLPGG